MYSRQSFRFRRAASQPLTFCAVFALVLSLVVSCSLPFGSADSAPNAANSAAPIKSTFTKSKVYDASLSYVPTDRLGLGTNLSGIADWSTELPFIDSFKSSRRWITQCDPGSSCGGKWDTEEYGKLDLDEHGWVKSLPTPEDSPEYTRVATLLLRDLSRYPGGKYVVLYEGEGTIEYQYDAKKDETASKPGRDVIDVTPSQGGIYLIITATDPNKTGNYIRNIRVVPIEYENTYETEIFNPLFLERMKKFGAIRFMDWMATNNSEQREWSNRPQVEDATYAAKGVPAEIMIELANRLRAHPWFNMPHLATDEYMTNFAKLVKERLDPQLQVYVEYSNEVWNWMFSQAHYALEQGKAKWGDDKGDAFMQWYGMRTAQMSDIWKGVFSDQPDRVISVISSQTGWRGLETSSLDCSLWVAEGNQPCYQHGIDAYAITGYFGGGLGSDQNQKTVETWLNQAGKGIDTAFAQLKQGNVLQAQNGDTNDSLTGTADLFNYHARVAQQKGLQLVAYEGGQHLLSPNNEKVTEFFIALNRNPKMQELYTQLLNAWKQAGGGMFMNFTSIGTPSKWGSWGVLEHVDQKSSPKYDALMRFIEQEQLR